MSTTYDEFVRTDGDDLWDRIRRAHGRFASVISEAPPDRRAAGSDWDTRQVATHVLTVLRRYTERDITDPAGLSDSAQELGRQNEEELREFADTSISEALELIAGTLDRIEARIPRDTDLHALFPFHGGQRFDAAAGLGNLIGEFLMHGRDVARASGRRWPIDAQDAALILNVGVQVVPGFVSPEAPGDLALEIRTPHTRPWLLDLRDGVATSRASRKEDRVDLRLFGRAQAILLNLYGRVGLVGATLHGTTIAGGRRPWRIIRLPRTYLKP